MAPGQAGGTFATVLWVGSGHSGNGEGLFGQRRLAHSELAFGEVWEPEESASSEVRPFVPLWSGCNRDTAGKQTLQDGAREM